MLSLLLSTSSLIIHHDATQACLHINWRVRPQASTPTLSHQHILISVQQTQSTKLLNNCLAVSNGWGEVAAWLANGHFLSLAHVGVHTVAWVLPRVAPRYIRTKRLLRNVNCLLVDTFTDTYTASIWLQRW